MGVKTKAEFIESIRALRPTAYMFGKRVKNVLDNPRIRAGIEATAATYEVAEKPEYRDLVVAVSPLINEPVNSFTLPPSSIEDLVARVKLNRKLGNYVGTCHQRCTGLDCLSALSIVTYDIDEKYANLLLRSVLGISQACAEGRSGCKRRRDRVKGRSVPCASRSA